MTSKPRPNRLSIETLARLTPAQLAVIEAVVDALLRRQSQSL